MHFHAKEYTDVGKNLKQNGVKGKSSWRPITWPLQGRNAFLRPFRLYSQGAVSVKLIRRFVTRRVRRLLTDACLAGMRRGGVRQPRRVTRSEGVAVLIARGRSRPSDAARPANSSVMNNEISQGLDCEQKDQCLSAGEMISRLQGEATRSVQPEN